jgi:hypothetical protein
VNSNGRPFMGPNLYVTPPGTFTHFHQDGHGTVDSGHFCVSGNNEVVMLRRLTERHKNHALSLLRANANYNALYELPHGDGLVCYSHLVATKFPLSLLTMYGFASS